MGFFVFGLFSGGYKVVAVPLGISHDFAFFVVPVMPFLPARRGCGVRGVATGVASAIKEVGDRLFSSLYLCSYFSNFT